MNKTFTAVASTSEDWEKSLAMVTLTTNSLQVVENMEFFTVGFINKFIKSILASEREKQRAELIEKIKELEGCEVEFASDDDYISKGEVIEIIKNLK